MDKEINMELIRTKNNTFICSQCRLKQIQIQPYCHFCGEYFSNYESVILELFKEKEDLKNIDLT